MPQFSPLRTAIILIAAIAGALFTLPNLLSTQTLDALPGWLPKQQMVLGLDLQGGSHLLMQVNRQEIIDERIADLRRDARSILANERGIGNIITTNGMVLTIELTNPAQLEEARQALQPLTAGVATLLLGIGSVQDVV
ncbi:MAG: protein translocase subunit SecDF, partial [Cucumibacter sp.]